MPCSCTSTPADPTCVRLEAVVGESVVITLTATDTSVTPNVQIDLNDYVIESEIRDAPGGTLVGSFTVVVSGDGVAVLSFDTTGLDRGTYHFDVRAVNGGQSIYFLKKSTVKITLGSTE